MERFGIDYEAVAERNPKIIYRSISGFGQEGPYAEYPALDIIAQAMSGNMSITGPPDSKPYRSGIPIADIAGSMYAVQGILGALFRRERTGEGQYVDVSMLDCMLSWLTVRAGYTFATDEPYPRMGNKLTSLSPTVSSKQQIHTSRSSSFRTITGKSCVPLSVALSSRRTTGFRRPTSDAKTGTNSNQFWKTNPATQSTDEWFDVMSNHGVLSGPIYDTKEVWEDDHVNHREILSSIQLGDEELSVVDHPVKYADDTTGITRGVPRVGEDTYETLERMGYTEAEVAELIEVASSDRQRRPTRSGREGVSCSAATSFFIYLACEVVIGLVH